MNPIIVTAAVIFNDDKVLITQRKVGTNEELKWEFPGGKLEEGESPEECLTREIKEELNINISVGDIYKVVYHEYPKITILLLAYECKLIDKDIIPRECNDYRWITNDEFNNYNFAAADVPIVDMIKNKISNKIE